MPQGFNYAKWDKLELSDDEDNHPGAKFIEVNALRYDLCSLNTEPRTNPLTLRSEPYTLNPVPYTQSLDPAHSNRIPEP